MDNPLEAPLSRRIIGPSGAQLQAIPNVIAVAYGAEKAEGIAQRPDRDPDQQPRHSYGDGRGPVEHRPLNGPERADSTVEQSLMDGLGGLAR